MKPPSPPQTKVPLRWWPALLLLAGAGIFLGWVWGFEDIQRQGKNLQTIGVVLGTLLLLLLWAVFFSRLPRRIRFSIAIAALACGGLTAALLEIKGVTGDLMPILGWRWQRPAPPLLASSNTPPTSPTSAPSPAASLPPPEHDYPQFLGPTRNGQVQGPALARNWQEQPPEQLWRHPVGAGWAGFAVSGTLTVTLEQHGENEAVCCYELLTGRLVWSRAYPAHYQTTIAGEGPRNVPAIAGRHLYTLGATGILTCLGLDDGTVLWTKNILEDNQSRLPEWGVSCSPLVVGHMVVVSAGGPSGRSLVAYHTQTGARIWSGGNDPANYSSPVLGQFADVRQILIFNEAGVSSHAADSGSALWSYPWRRGHPHVTDPLPLSNDRLLVSSGYGTGSELLRIRQTPPGQWSVTRLWKSIRLKSKFANLIARDGHVYGLDDGILVCLDLETGQLRWKEGRYGHGQLILANDLLLIQAESGEVALLEPSPQEHRELTRLTVFQDKTWNPPALAGPYLLVRNHKEAACYRLPVLSPPAPRDRKVSQL